MILGRVIGDIVSTIHHPYFSGSKMLVVEKTSPDGKATGDYLIAIDHVGAGPGERVLIVDEGNSARQILDSTTAPVRAVIAAIVDEVDVQPYRA